MNEQERLGPGNIPKPDAKPQYIKRPTTLVASVTRH